MALTRQLVKQMIEKVSSGGHMFCAFLVMVLKGEMAEEKAPEHSIRPCRPPQECTPHVSHMEFFIFYFFLYVFLGVDDKRLLL